MLTEYTFSHNNAAVSLTCEQKKSKNINKFQKYIIGKKFTLYIAFKNYS